MNDESPAPRLLSSKEAARYLNICARTLWTLQNAGTVRSLRIGRKVLFDRADLDGWIERRKSVRK